MQKLTNTGENLVNNIASRYGLSHDAVVHMLVAVNNGGCSMAQFNCPELGGSGQWMQGGMTMVGDMFNMGLKNTVDGCDFYFVAKGCFNGINTKAVLFCPTNLRNG